MSDAILKPTRILHIFGCMEPGGAEMRTLDLMRRAPRERFTFEFCSLSARRGRLDEDIRNLGGDVHYCKLRSLSFPLAFSRLLQRGGYDVVHSHVHYFSGCILMLARLCGVPIRIAHFRNTTDGHRWTPSHQAQTCLKQRWIRRHATHILAVGHGAMEHSWGPDWHRDRRCAVIPNGLDVAAFETPPDPQGVRREFAIPGDGPLLLHVGRMSPQKNHVGLAAILGGLLVRRPHAYAILVGNEDDAIKNAMLARFSECGVENRVRFAGVRRDVARILLASDLLLFPSLWEGLPGAVLEACAAGTPVLASDIPGIRELVGAFASLRTLSLDAPVDEWIDLADALTATRPDREDRRNALTHFRQTPYAIERCLASHVRAWSGCDGRTIMASGAG